MKNKTTFIVKTFLFSNIKVVLFFSFCHFLMIKLGSKILYQRRFYKIEHLTAFKAHRFNFVKTLAYVVISKQFLHQAVASKGLKPSPAGLPLQNAPTTSTMMILGHGPQF